MVKLNGAGSISAALSWKSKTDEPALQSPSNESAVQKNIKTLLQKSVLGALLTEIPVVANLIQFIITGGAELGMMCLTFCMIDVFWDCLVLHWLTFGSSAAAEKDLLRSTGASSRLGLVGDRQGSMPTLRCSSSRREAGVHGLEAPEAAFITAPQLEVAVRPDPAHVS